MSTHYTHLIDDDVPQEYHPSPLDLVPDAYYMLFVRPLELALPVRPQDGKVQPAIAAESTRVNP